MCGISGFYSCNKLSTRYIKAMTDLIRHRGPDDEGYVVFAEMGVMPSVCMGDDTASGADLLSTPYSPKISIGKTEACGAKVALGHRRLSILDLTPLGHQPMCTQDGRYWIVFNGEVYNYTELRKDLERLGHSFVSQTDTEVVLAAYVQWGDACLHRFNGMWSIAIFDNLQGALFLARDRFGVKPLYYWVSPDSFLAFASEVKQFTVLPGWNAYLNGQRAYDFLAYGVTDHTEETIFSGVYHIRPGHCITISFGDVCALSPGQSLQTSAWYELRPRTFEGNFDDAAVEFRQLFEESMALRLRADVSVGSCLSGGLDSSSIVCVLNNLLRKQGKHSLQKTFSACSDVERFDERKWIELVVNKTGVDAHYVYPALHKLFEEFPFIAWHQDEPFGSTSIYAQWSVFKLAAQHGVKVMLDGQGADEILAGYHPYHFANNAELVLKCKFISLWREIRYVQELHNISKVESLLKTLYILLPHSMRKVSKNFLNSELSAFCLNKKALFSYGKSSFEFKIPQFTSIYDLSYAQLTSINLPMLLRLEDRDSMAHGIESRVPFLDYNLVEYSLGLCGKYKIFEGTTKKVLRHSMANVLPIQIFNRMDKMGFVTPEEYWIKAVDPVGFRKRIEGAVAVCSGFLSPNILTYFEEFVSGKQTYSSFFWRVISFSEWANVFKVHYQ